MRIKNFVWLIRNFLTNQDVSILTPAVSHIPQFGDATTSLAGDAASPAGDVDVSARDAHL
jgi:hypothetical protein